MMWVLVLGALLRGERQEEANVLPPRSRIEVWGKITSLLRHPVSNVIYALDVSAHRVLVIDAAGATLSRSASVTDGAERLAFSPDGKRLFVAISPHGHRPSTEVEEGQLLELDPETLKIERSVTIPLDPFDLLADGRFVYVSGGSNPWSHVAAVDLKSFSLQGWWSPKLPGGSFLRAGPDRGRIYSSSDALSPQRPEVWRPDPDSVGAPRHGAYRGRLDLGSVGEFEITPDGRFLVGQSGIVLGLSEAAKDDLQPRLSLRRTFLAFAFPAGQAVCYASDERGELHEYSYPGFVHRRSFALGTKAYRMTPDAGGTQLFAAVYPGGFLKSERGGPGDLAVYDLKNLPGVPLETEPVEPLHLDLPAPRPGGDPGKKAPDPGEPRTCPLCGGTKKMEWATVELGVRTDFSRPCPRCAGSGQVRTAKCPCCGGVGQELVHATVVLEGTPVVVSEWASCGRCRGEKEVLESPYAQAFDKGETHPACLSCRGTGKTEWDYSVGGRAGKLEKKCEECRGKGIELGACGDCKGTGWVYRLTTLTLRGSAADLLRAAPCPRCQGTRLTIAPRE